ncbi:FeoB-associated Cys-rich membrane protein [Massilia sp. CF038]|uniref:FeoB-associated Cys-rich membrane protein n=1 Tax=Massilia sp. CF038 TaxID=1881045 RepID=UPI00092072B9|nr:FeoB-associated Cys-rich membrane protein [Massilia sp. CF038]SHH55933.1 Virus attachment protein p12 family protein [Massilia sp. CF038]
MIENLIVALIVGASAWYTARKYVFKPKKSAGCGSGCSSCDTCESAPAPAADPRVIKLHRVG